MRISFLLMLLFCCTSNLWSQEFNQTLIDPRINKEILSGPVTMEAFQFDLCKNWYKSEYNNYSPSKRTMKKLREEKFNNITFTIALGSWCHDSHREVPRFMKTLKQINYPVSKVKLFALDSYKNAPGFDPQTMNILKVPTFIIYRNGQEIGRIIETPKRRLEKDLLQIIVKN
ncbi:MAG: thioredoxin family protein [Marinifilaceae bacterium]